MGVQVSALLEKEVLTSFTWSGELVELYFLPANFTGAYVTDRDSGDAATIAWLAETLTDWNLDDDEGERLPIDVATLMALPVALTGAILQSIRRWNVPTALEIELARLYRQSAGPDGVGDAGEPAGEWYDLIMTARWMGVPPWELAEQPGSWYKMARAARRISSARTLVVAEQMRR